MKLRNINIIVCDCGAELNPEITTPRDFIKYDGTTATCSNCGASGAITMPSESEPIVYIDPVADLSATVDELITTLVDKGVLY